MIIKLDCVRCGRELSVRVEFVRQTPQVVSIECPAQCDLSLQEQFDIEVEALAIAEVDLEEEPA